MGLDMYLEAELYVGGRFEHRNARGELSLSFNDLGDKYRQYDIPVSDIESVTLSVGYWRKANAIHKWFVDNVQDGVDECQRSYVEPEKLLELMKICTTILEHKEKAAGMLPPQAGFFFGSTEIDEWYYQDLEETVGILTKALEYVEEGFVIYYQSSW